MKCKICGAQVPDDDKFCYNCGAKIEKAPARPPVEPVIVEPVRQSAEPVRHEPIRQSAEPADPIELEFRPQSGIQTRQAGRISKKTLIVLVTAAVVVFAGLGAAVALSGGGGADYTAKIEEAQKFVDSGDYESAIKTYDDAIAIEPKKADAYIGKADVQVMTGDRYRAIATLIEGRENASETKEIESKLKTVKKEYEGEWKTAYRKVILDYEVGIKGYENISNYGYDSNYVPYDSTALCDIDGDEIPELFFMVNGEDFQQNGLHIFTYADKKAQEIVYSVSTRSTYQDGVDPRRYFSHVPAGGEESGYIVFTTGGNLVMLNKYSDEEIFIEINQYEKAAATELEEVGFTGYIWSMIDNPGKSKVDLSTAEIYSDNDKGTKEGFEKEYRSMCDGMDEVIFCVREGDITDDEEIWNLAESKDKLSMTWDRMIKELTVEVTPRQTNPTQPTTKARGQWYDETLALLGELWESRNDQEKSNKLIAEHENEIPGSLKTRFEDFLPDAYNGIYYLLYDLNNNGQDELYIGMMDVEGQALWMEGVYVNENGKATLPADQQSGNGFEMDENWIATISHPVGTGVEERYYRFRTDTDAFDPLAEGPSVFAEELRTQGQWKKIGE